MRLVGRDREVAVLDALLAPIASGGGALLIRGDPGIGKSALLDVAGERARAAGLRVLTCAGVPTETRLPFAGLHQLLRPVRDDVEKLAAPERDVLRAALGEIAFDEIMPDESAADESRPGGLETGGVSVYRMAMAALDLLADSAERAPVLVVADDVHWLDEPTCEVLAFISRRLAADPVVVLAAGRDVEMRGNPLAAAGLPDLCLEPLDETAAAALLGTKGELDPVIRGRLLAWAAGNPLALMELPSVARELAALDDEPDSTDRTRAAGEAGSGHDGGPWFAPPGRLPVTRRLERAFSARLPGLPAMTRTALLVAALNDNGQLPEVLDAASRLAGRPVTAAELAPAVSAGLIRLDGDDADDGHDHAVHGHGGGSVRFRHPLVRAAVHNAATAAERQAAHGALAGALAGSTDRQAWHRSASATGPDEELATALADLALKAAHRGAVSTAITGLRRAAQLSGSPARRGERLVDAVDLAIDFGRPELIVHLVEEAEVVDLEPYARYLLTLLSEAHTPAALSRAQPIGDIAELAERLRLAGETEQARKTVWKVALRCWWSNPDPRDLRRLIATAEALPVPADHPDLLYILAMIAPVERGAAVLGRFRRLPPVSIGNADSVDGIYSLGLACVAVGDLPRAMEYLSAAERRCREQGRLFQLAVAVFCQAWAATLLGRPDVAVPAAEEAARLLAETGMARFASLALYVPCAHLAAALLAARRGDIAAAEALAAEAERMLLFAGINPLLALVQFVRGTAALADGRHDEAYGQLARVFDPGDVAYHPHLRSWILPDYVEAATRSGRIAEARARHAELVPLAETSPLLRVSLAITAPQLAEADTDAGSLYEQAIEADLAQWPLHRARLLFAYGSWLRRGLQVTKAREPLRTARDLFDAAGALRWGEQARRELRAAGEDSTPRTPTALDLLTPMELQVARLAASGLSNREIGQRLYLSPRTISSHLYRIFPKLGVTTRSGLAAIVAAAGSLRSHPRTFWIQLLCFPPDRKYSTAVGRPTSPHDRCCRSRSYPFGITAGAAHPETVGPRLLREPRADYLVSYWAAPNSQSYSASQYHQSRHRIYHRKVAR